MPFAVRSDSRLGCSSSSSCSGWRSTCSSRFPAPTPGGLWLTLHAVWGLVLVFGALGTLVQAIRMGGGGRITLAALGFVGVLAAGFNGGSFLNYNNNSRWRLMAGGFA